MIEARVRRATPQDLAAIVALERAAPEAPHWPEAVYAQILAEQGASTQRRAFLAETAVGTAGFAVGLTFYGRAPGEIESVVVGPAVRRAGIGSLLCGAVIAWCKDTGSEAVVLEVRTSSIGALALYRRLGFHEIGRRSGYYRDPEEDALVLRLNLE